MFSTAKSKRDMVVYGSFHFSCLQHAVLQEPQGKTVEEHVVEWLSLNVRCQGLPRSKWPIPPKQICFWHLSLVKIKVWERNWEIEENKWPRQRWSQSLTSSCSAPLSSCKILISFNIYHSLSNHSNLWITTSTLRHSIHTNKQFEMMICSNENHAPFRAVLLLWAQRVRSNPILSVRRWTTQFDVFPRITKSVALCTVL